ncbi:spore coat protein GerQ [Radiobacillus deserti]|uniref:Spore coat protein GerQ n=1 Tax=Radiobacillus deserti TaxID=2594883 RepID=A0A516KJZ7_9BACI|nr:spore coat protein GerQ [Radiobacillus deserti]QDP41707.1 spore coat protein GerQ [Radiobacillus deserti]
MSKEENRNVPPQYYQTPPQATGYGYTPTPPTPTPAQAQAPAPQAQAVPTQPYYPTGTPAYGPVPGVQVPPAGPAASVPGMLPIEESYIENILRLNKGKLAVVYASFDNNSKVFTGIIEAAGRDHLILSDPETENRFLIPMIYLDYVTFDEEINYEYPYGAAPGNQLLAYPPR